MSTKPEKMSVEIQVKYRYTASQDPEERFQSLIKFLSEQSGQGKAKKEKNRNQDDSCTLLPR